MYRIVRISSITTLIIVAGRSYIFAATPDEGIGSGNLMIFGATAVVAVVIGLILYRMARSERELKGERIERKSSYRGPLTSVIAEQIDSLPGSIKDREGVAGTILNMVNKEIEKKTEAVKEELGQRYGKMIEHEKLERVAIQKKYNQTISEKKQTESVLRSVAEGLVVVNDKGDVVLMNPAAEKLLDVKKEEKIGKPVLEDVKDEQLISLVKGTSVGEKEIVVSSKKVDTKKILRSSTAVIEDENGKTVGMVAVLSDITKQRELDGIKSDFVSNVSHELRTPIVAIQKSLSVILEGTAGPLTTPQEKFLSTAKRNLERLNRLINDLLDLSKLEAKKMTVKLEPSSIEKIIDETCETLDTWAKTKAITIEKIIQQGIPQVPIDSLRIMQVLTNIIGNAIKFTPNNGRVIVEAKFRENSSEIEVNITDTGVGIAKEELPKVFDKFQQVGERSWTDIGGTGLGLSIAKEIIELHKGKIWVESEKGQGAKFTFTLPMR